MQRRLHRLLAGSTGIGIVPSNGCQPNLVGGYCKDNFRPDSVEAYCSAASDCNVTSVSEESGRLHTRNSYSYWRVGGCTFNAASGTCRFNSNANDTRIDCCVGLGGGSGGRPAPPCSPEYGPPSLALGGYTPAYPLVISQDPDRLGITVTIVATGGGVTNGCNDGPSQRTLTGLTVSGVKLADASTAWIQSYLAQRYPGARVKGSYPFLPDVTVSGIGTQSASLRFHFEPLDLGYYAHTATATQDDSQSATATFHVPAYLLDSTLTLPKP